MNSEYIIGPKGEEPWFYDEHPMLGEQIPQTNESIEIGILSCNRFGLITSVRSCASWPLFISASPESINGLNITQILPGFDSSSIFSESTLGPGFVGSSYVKVKGIQDGRNHGHRISALIKHGDDCAPNEYSILLSAQPIERESQRFGSVSSKKLTALTSRFTEIIASVGETINDEEELILSCVDALMMSGIFHSVWVGSESFHSGCFDISLAVGAGSSELKRFKIPATATDELHPLSAKALLTNSICHSNDLINTKGLSPWRDFFIAHRWRSTVAMPVGEKLPEMVMVAASPIANLFQPPVLDIMVTLQRLMQQSLRLLRQQLQTSQYRQNTLWLSTHDQATSLCNRAQFENLLYAKTKEGGEFALCFIDIDGLRSINSLHGNEVGDQVISKFANAMVETFENNERVFRIGGDQFAVLIDQATDPEYVKELFDNLSSLSGIKIKRIGTVNYTWTTGVAFYPQDAGDYKEVIRCAEQALYQAKKVTSKLGSLNFYAEIGGLPKISTAFKSGNAFLLYQPIVSLQSKRVIGFEALSRWTIDNRTLTPPEFLSQFDKKEARDFRRAVFKEALAVQQRIRPDGQTLSMSINTTPDDLCDPNFATELLALLPTSADPKDIVLEILETGEILASQIAYANIAQIRAFGIRIALDDVGSGYSSLLRFRELPIDEIKIDKDFARDILHSPKNLAFFDTIVQLGNGVGVDIVAEGAETPLHVEALSQTGVGFLQGYGISRPIPESKLREFASNYQLAMADSSQMWFGALLDHLRLLGRLTQDVKIPHRRINLAQELDARCSLDNWMSVEPYRFGNLTLIRESHSAFHTLAQAVVESAAAGSYVRLEKLADMARTQASQMVELMTIELTKPREDSI